MGLVESLQSKKGKKFMGYLYGWGAAVVIVGAMFKIQHWPGASAMLVSGLTIEAIIFFFSAFEPIHEEIDWSLVYPELAGMHDDDHGHGHGDKKKVSTKDPIAAELDKMLAEAKIGPELIQSLGEGMKNLGEQAGKIANITDASAATNEYVSNVKSAAKTVGELSEGYLKASAAIGSIADSNTSGTMLGDEMTKMSKNLSSLNSAYELQLQGANEHLKATTQMYDGIAQMITSLSSSIDDTKKYKQEVNMLANNLEQLNRVYGNMLTALKS